MFCRSAIRSNLAGALLPCILLLASCRVPTAVEEKTVAAPEPAPSAPPGTVTEGPPTNPPCAILLSESNLGFARAAPWTGGPSGYSNLVLGLQRALAAEGTAADLLSEEDLAAGRLCRYRVLYVVDTFSISRDAEEAIRYFVHHGGVLVGVNEVGRVQAGNWTSPWHYQDLFGVQTLKTDEFGTSLSWASDLFQYAEVTPAGLTNALTRDLGDLLPFGPQATGLWVTQPTTAEVLAVFPSYMAVTPPPEKDVSLIDDPVIAMSVNLYGLGLAVWIAPNMHNRDPAGWEEAGVALELLKRAAALRPTRAPIPPPPPRVYLGLSQVGYAPNERKPVVIRVTHEPELPFSKGTFVLTDEAGRLVRNGDLAVAGQHERWGDWFYTADLTGVTNPGRYRLAADLEGRRGTYRAAGGPFAVGTGLWTAVVVPTQYAFFRDYRCGEACHTTDPIRGAYHDATGDYSTRMWSMPHVAYGMAENIMASQALPSGPRVRPLEELRRCVDWMIAMQDADGTVWKSVKPPKDYSPLELRPPDDPTARVLERGFNLNYQTTYAAGLAHAAAALRAVDPDRARRALLAAQKAHALLVARDWERETSGEIGNYLWGCVELHRATGTPLYLERALRVLPLVLDRQFTRPDRVEGGLQGDFLDQPNLKDFGRKQYKQFHQIGLYLGLVELAAARPHADPRRERILQALDLYFSEHLLRGAALTPYGQMITALEPADDGSFRLRFFTHPDSWVRLHGLNVDHLALGLVALKYADLSGRDDVRDFARAQAQWVVGCNPFGYCMIDYLGWTNAPVMADHLGTGRFPGGIPNGIIGDGNDRPAWGDTWDSREYWIPHNAYLLAIAPHLDAAGAR